MELLFVWVLFSVLVGVFWGSKSRSSIGGFVVSLLLSPLVGLVIGLCLSPNTAARERRAVQDGELKKCPHCAEVIRREAKVCRYCSRELVVAAPPRRVRRLPEEAEQPV
jgi:hypothetical protein